MFSDCRCFGETVSAGRNEKGQKGFLSKTKKKTVILSDVSVPLGLLKIFS